LISNLRNNNEIAIAIFKFGDHFVFFGYNFAFVGYDFAVNY